MTTEAKLNADKVTRAMEDLAGIFDALEKQALDIAVTQHWQHQAGEENARRALERVKVIRDLRANVAALATAGAQTEKKADEVEQGISSYV